MFIFYIMYSRTSWYHTFRPNITITTWKLSSTITVFTHVIGVLNNRSHYLIYGTKYNIYTALCYTAQLLHNVRERKLRISSKLTSNIMVVTPVNCIKVGYIHSTLYLNLKFIFFVTVQHKSLFTLYKRTSAI